jgi:hypothetical protein
MSGDRFHPRSALRRASAFDVGGVRRVSTIPVARGEHRASMRGCDIDDPQLSDPAGGSDHDHIVWQVAREGFPDRRSRRDPPIRRIAFIRRYQVPVVALARCDLGLMDDVSEIDRARRGLRLRGSGG